MTSNFKINRSLLLILMASCFFSSNALADCVLLVHGLARSDASLFILDQNLKNAGYETFRISYPSRKADIDELANLAFSDTGALCPESNMHIVTHSLGGILVRVWLARGMPENLGRVVMLGPPNHGSEMVDMLRDFPLFEWIYGNAGLQLGTTEEDLPSQLPPVNFELGVIAGRLSINPILTLATTTPNDGVVTVASTRIDGMQDHVTVMASHSLMMNNPIVIAQTISFLRTGIFFEDLSPIEALHFLNSD
jgi:hypothetical protein